jgi:hypothetical protein
VKLAQEVLVCLSAEVDLVAGLVVGAAGVDALLHVEDRREIGVAALPVILGAHQLVEAVAWWGLQGKVAATAGDIAVWIYLLVAFGILPAYVPAAVARLETDQARRRAMHHLALIGAAVSLVLVAAMVRGPVEATIGGRYIAYEITLTFGGVVVAGYALAVCGGLLLSSHRIVARFGAFNVLAVAVLTWLNTTGFASLWCAWAAIASLGIAYRLRSGSLVPEESAAGLATG